MYPIQTLKDTFVDFVIQGEGDYSFLELIECLKHKKNYSKIDVTS